MNAFYDISFNIKNILESSSLLDNVRFVDALESSLIPNPIKKIYAAFEISSTQITGGVFSGYIGKNINEELYGKLADINIGIKIYSPYSIGSNACYDVFSNICEVLLKSSEENLNIQSICSEKVHYDVNTSNFILNCNVKVTTLVGFSENIISG